MSRPRNPRRLLVEMLVKPRERLDWINRKFTGISRMTYDFDNRDQNGSVTRRQRRPDEYPENSKQVWSDVYMQTWSTIEQLTKVMEYAKTQHRRVCESEANQK